MVDEIKRTQNTSKSRVNRLNRRNLQMRTRVILFGRRLVFMTKTSPTEMILIQLSRYIFVRYWYLFHYTITQNGKQQKGRAQSCPAF